MKVTLNDNTCIVERENGPKVYKESTLMTWVKRELQRQGYDVIMKDLSKEDGNLLSEGCYGVISRNRKSFKSFVVWYPAYCLRANYEFYNQRGVVEFDVVRNDSTYKLP